MAETKDLATILAQRDPTKYHSIIRRLVGLVHEENSDKVQKGSCGAYCICFIPSIGVVFAIGIWVCAIGFVGALAHAFTSCHRWGFRFWKFIALAIVFLAVLLVLTYTVLTN